MNQKLSISVAALVCVVALSLLTSCSSNSSNPVVITPDPQVVTVAITPDPQVVTVAITLDTDTGAAVRDLISAGFDVADEASQAAVVSQLSSSAGTPAENGSVIQTASDTTAEVTVASYPSGLQYDWQLSGNNSTLAVTVISSDVNVRSARGSLGDFDTIGMRRLFSAGGEYYVNLFTDHEGDESVDPDYLTGGFWLYAPTERSDSNDYAFGVFADGNQEFDFNFSPALLSGSATYDGEAAGVCDCSGESDTTVALRIFEANAQLSATFGSTGNTISGSITDFVVDGEELTGDRARTISLIENRSFDDGFFTGQTALDGNEMLDHGEWGGEFYGLRNANNPFPGSIGGTFGATDGTETFVGAFGVHRSGGSALRRPSTPVELIFRNGIDMLRIQAPDAVESAVEQVAGAFPVPSSSGEISSVDQSDNYTTQVDLSDGATRFFQLTGPLGNVFVEGSEGVRDVLGEFQSIGISAGMIYANIFTDHNGGKDDPDYLAGGYWLNFVPAEGSMPASASFGAFASGNQLFEYSAVTLLSGSATYSGKAAGICNCEGVSETVSSRVFEADAALSADFTESTISGLISDFVIDGQRLTGDQVRAVRLLEQEFSDSFFAGSTSLLDESTESSHGEWGGQFFGDDANNAFPGSIGGTFGASHEGETFVGAFGAHLDD